MTDRRLLRSNGRVADLSLKGQVSAETFTQGTLRTVRVPATTLGRAPNGARERTLVFGETFCVLEEGAQSFGYTPRDGFVGHVAAEDLTDDMPAPTHIVSATLTLALQEPDIKTPGAQFSLSIGALISVVSQTGTWAELGFPDGSTRFVPAVHIRPLSEPETDPVAVAERLIGTPYDWGGNSAFGIDCSGLVQMGLRLCGQACPGDSDQQEAALGTTLDPGTPALRGDLVFWKGHVAWVSDPDTILHANAFNMAVAYEPLDQAIARIHSQGEGPVTRHTRLT